MALAAGVREFRTDLAEFIDQTEPVTVTRHGQIVGLFIPIHRDRQAEIDAYAAAARRANDLINAMGISEDQAVSEIAAMRAEERQAVAVA